jgi:hypothetical protein
MNELREPDLLASLPEAGSGLLIPAVVILLAASVGAILWFRRKPGVHPFAPHEVAFRALEGTIDYTGLSVILRKYIADRFGVPALRQVPEETIACLRDRLPAGQLESLSTLLMNIEGVMYDPAREGDERDFESAKDFVNETALEGGSP